MSDPQNEGFGLYVHWPFCVSKCPYCDFNSHVGDSVDDAAWQSALLAELDHYGALTEGRHLTSVFFGGGTPSLMAPDTVAALLDRAAHWWRLDNGLEISLEANPGTVDRDRFTALRQAGIKRLSLGIQSLNDEDLRFLGRVHDAGEARRAITTAMEVFDDVSFDLIYALPDQSIDRWQGELERALKDFDPSHLSLYQLTIEPGTAFETAVDRGDFTPMDEESAADQFELTQQIMAAAGRPAYEVSNHAAAGKQCRHNLTYWRGGDYVGIGPGAHGRLTLDGITQATRQKRLPDKWLSSVAEQGHATAENIKLSAEERGIELLLSGLRLADGISEKQFERLSGRPLSTVIDEGSRRSMMHLGLVDDVPFRLAITEQGRPVLNRVLAELLA